MAVIPVVSTLPDPARARGLGLVVFRFVHLLFRAAVGGRDESLAARPAEDEENEHERIDDVGRGGHELLAQRVGRRCRGGGVVVQRDAVCGLGHADGAWSHRGHVRGRAGADHVHDRAERDRDRIRSQEDRDHADLRGVAENLRHQHPRRICLRIGQDLAALFCLLPELLQFAPEHPPQQEDQEGAADDDQQREQRVVAEPAQLHVEGRSRLEEQQDVDERADDGEEDLVDDVGGEYPAKVEPGISATNISSVTNVPMFAGRKLFIATPTA